MAWLRLHGWESLPEDGSPRDMLIHEVHSAMVFSFPDPKLGGAQAYVRLSSGPLYFVVEDLATIQAMLEGAVHA